MADQADNQEEIEQEQAEEQAPEQQEEVQASSEESEAAEQSEEQATQFEPNYTFKAYDKEYEFDDFVREAIKSKEHEEKLREIYAKAYGLDDLKPKYETKKEEAEQFKSKYENITQNLGALEQYVNMKDYDSFFNTLKIPEKEVFKWVANKLNYQDMDEEQRAAYDESLKAKREAVQYQTQYQQMQQQMQAIQTQQIQNELEQTLSDPNIGQVAKIYDERMGQEGAFREAVIRQGDAIYNQTGEVKSPRSLAAEIADGLKKIIGPLEDQSTPQEVRPQTPKPTIPNIKSKSGSPTKRAPKSIADLEKIAQERYGI